MKYSKYASIPDTTADCMVAGYRVLPILTDNGDLVENAQHICWAYSLWPEDKFTADFAAQIIQRFDASSSAVPEIVAMIQMTAKARQKTLDVTATISQILIGSVLNDRSSSLRRAVSSYSKHMMGINARERLGYPASEDSARSAFRTYKSVSHLAAAQLLMSRLNQQIVNEWPKGTKTIEATLGYAAQYQLILMGLGELGGTKIDKFNPWLVPPELARTGFPYYLNVTDDFAAVASDYAANPMRHDGQSEGG